MNRFVRSLVPLVLGLPLLASTASATPIITIYTSESDLLATLPPGTGPEDVVVGEAEFGDTFQGHSQDFGVIHQGNGTIEEIPDPPPSLGSEFWWSTTGPISFALDPTSSIGGAASANGFIISYASLAPGQALPSVSMTLDDGSLVNVGLLDGGPFEAPGQLFFAFTSTEPFTTVSLGLDSGAPLRTQFVAFDNVPAAPSSVPEPATILLVASGVLVSGRRLVRSGRT